MGRAVIGDTGATCEHWRIRSAARVGRDDAGEGGAATVIIGELRAPSLSPTPSVHTRARSAASISGLRVNPGVGVIERMAVHAFRLGRVASRYPVASHHVLSPRRRFQVGRVHAGSMRTRRATRALVGVMAGVVKRQSFGDRTDEEFVCEAVRLHALRHRNREVAVTSQRVLGPRPAPAVSLRNLRPESLLYGENWTGFRRSRPPLPRVMNLAETTSVHGYFASDNGACDHARNRNRWA